MAIKIQKVLTTVPIEIGDVKFDFNVTDESMIKLRKSVVSMETKIKKIAEENNDAEKELEKVKIIFREEMDSTLGEGVFDRLYELSPSFNIILAYYIQIAKEVSDTFSSMDVNKYVKRFNK